MTTQTLAQSFAAEYAKGVVPAMLKTIKAAKRDTRIIIAAVLAITYWHQAHWLTQVEGIDRLGYAIPLVVDLAMLRMLGIVQTVGMRRPAKLGALVMTSILGAMSATVNVAAPAAPAARVIFGALVLMAVGVKIVTSLIGPDFAAIEQRETAATSIVVVEAAPTGPDPALSERARRAAQTRRENAARAAAEQAAAEQAEAARKQEAAERRRQRQQDRRDAAKANAAQLFAAIAAEAEPGYVDATAPVSPAPTNAYL